MKSTGIKVIVWFLIALGIALAPWIVLAQAQTPQKQKFNIHKEGEDAIGYAQAVRVGSTLYISGSVGSGDMLNAVRTVYDELAITLKAYGANFHHVVKENVFTTDIESFKAFQQLRKTYYGDDFPAATWVEVKQLYSPELVLEVELIAELE